jgi:peptide deformylase
MIKKILTYPEPVLRKKASTVTEFNQELKEIIADMADTMFDAPGAGLAAPQIGISKRIVVINTSKREGDADKKILALINPVILSGEGSQIDEEGCLSVRDFSAKVKRFMNIKVRAQDPEGQELEFEAEEFFARVIQHEVDHIEGVLYIDHISSLKRNLYKRRLKKLLQTEAEEKSE